MSNDINAIGSKFSTAMLVWRLLVILSLVVRCCTCTHLTMMHHAFVGVRE